MEYDSNYTHYQLKRSYLRKIIRKIYLQEIVKKNIGKAIDFGCGVGELLEKLPEGSLGFDINSYTKLPSGHPFGILWKLKTHKTLILSHSILNTQYPIPNTQYPIPTYA